MNVVSETNERCLISMEQLQWLFFGPAITARAVVGYAVHIKASKEEVRRRDLLYIFLAVPSITNFLASLVGLGEMNE